MDVFPATFEVENEASIRLKCNNSPPEPEKPDNQLCEDELSLIFSQEIISTKDLLRFRQVNKSWRDAATRILLQRDACCISLVAQIVIEGPEYAKRGLVNPAKFYFRKRGDADANLNKLSYLTELFSNSPEDADANLNKLSDLTELFSNSPQFPSSNLHLHISDRCRYYCFDEPICYAQCADLLLFFSLHGDKIKRLAPHGVVSQEQIRDILCTFTPKLECLDLSDVTMMPLSPSRFEKQDCSAKWTSKFLTFKSLTIPLDPFYVDSVINDDVNNRTYEDRVKASYDEILHLLLSSPSSLNCIKNVYVNAVRNILKENKGHLIKGFEFKNSPTASITCPAAISLLQQLAAVNPKLLKLTLEAGHNGYCMDTLTAVNALLKSSKDTLEELELSLNPTDHYTKLKIYAMKNLKSIHLSGPRRFGSTEKDYRDERDYNIFEDGISAEKYFLSLAKLCLANLTIERNCQSFFQFQCNEDGSVSGGGLPKLEVLEIMNCSLPENPYSCLMSKFFPNVRLLKISFDHFRVEDLRGKSSLWAMFPLLEFMEIIISLAINNFSFHARISCFDKFFTGFPLGLCQILRSAELPDFMNIPEGLKFLRVKPSITDLRHLKEFKLKFTSKLKSDVLTHVTGAYAFLKMPNTKFNIAYNPETYKDDAEAELCFASIKPYAQILQEK